MEIKQIEDKVRKMAYYAYMYMSVGDLIKFNLLPQLQYTKIKNYE